MAGIPPELIFVLIFIAFSVLEGIGRKKKAERKGAPGTVPGPQRRSVQNQETVVRRTEAGMEGASEPTPARFLSNCLSNTLLIAVWRPSKSSSSYSTVMR